MNENHLYQQTHENMIFSAYMRRCYKYDIALLEKKERCHCPEKIHLRLTSLASPKKMIFILENMVFLLKYHVDWHSRKGSRSSHGRWTTRKGVLRNVAKFTRKDLCQSLFYNKVTHLRPATLLSLQLY